ncbi:hypothetical protein DID78_04010, partial [Candidatus Marinamargulisbacteria bacterium SCGC AG-343-D04]
MQAILSSSFSLLDTLIVVTYLGLSLLIGLFARKHINSMDDYVSAGRNIKPFLGVATMAGTEMGLITIMYSAQKGFSSGFAAFHIALIAGIVTFLVGISGFIVVPLRKLQVLTIPEFYEKRFDKKTRVLGGVMLAIGGILNMGLFLKVGAMFIGGVTGLSQHSWAVPAIMTALLLLVLIYTTMGGMISVILTDYVQFVVLSFGLLVTVILAIKSLGWSTIFEQTQLMLGSAGFNPLSSEGEFGITYVLWMIITAGLVSCA